MCRRGLVSTGFPLGFAGLAVAALTLGGRGWPSAATKSRTRKSAPANATATPKIAVADTAAVTQTATAKPAAQAGAQKSSAMPAAHKGQHQGIKVHGHWAIEVRDPDGSVVRHVEVENSLVPGFPLSYTTSTNAIPSGTENVPGGAAFLNALLNGQAFSNPDSCGILLVGPEGLTNLWTTYLWNAPPPCVTSGFNFPPATLRSPLGTCFLFRLLFQVNDTSEANFP